MHAATSTHIILSSVQQKNQNFHFRATRLLFQIACLGILALGTSACTLSKAVDTNDLQTELVTGSISKAIEAEGVDATDTEVIKTVVVQNDGTQASSNSLAWQNPDTGNSGTIIAIEKFVGPQGRQCKKFQTTVDSFMGISIYDGETCEVKKGFWILSQFFKKKL